MMAKILGNYSVKESLDWETRLLQLNRIRQHLLIVLGAVSTFLVLGLSEPAIMEKALLPFIWFLLIAVPSCTGLILLFLPSWQLLPLRARRSTVAGAIGTGLLALSYLPVLSAAMDSEYGPGFAILALVTAFGVGLVYRWLAQPITTDFDAPEADWFP